jgi:hypothetical protein
MHRHPAAWIVPLFSVATLTACQRSVPPTPAPAASVALPVASVPVAPASAPARGAADDSKEALMQEAFPAWKVGGEQVLHVPDRERSAEYAESAIVAAHPTMVVKMDATHRALVTVGRPSDEHGDDTASHADSGAVGVYVFELRTGRWFETRAQDAVAWTGSFGQVGEVKAVDLGPGHPALFVTGSHTGQGETTVWADVVEIESAGARVVLPGLQLHEDVFGGSSQDCEDWVNGLREPTDRELADELDSQCQEVTGRWRIEQAGDSGRGDIVVAYTSHGVEADPQTHLNAFVIADETVRYRYAASGYAKRGEPESREPATAVSPPASTPP